ncbi:hypothetical protein M3Y96_00570300 [Aphelenchoides besseyi]|nr:hypothetical protein M3Y96_00570300 [Aphelenchoides besseyi]
MRKFWSSLATIRKVYARRRLGILVTCGFLLLWQQISKSLESERLVSSDYEEIVFFDNYTNFVDSPFKLIDDEDEKLYGIDFSLSHPFENSCRYPVLEKEEPDASEHIAHCRAVKCPHTYNRRLVVQLRTGELLVANPAESTFHQPFDCYARPLTCALRPAHKQVCYTDQWIPLPKNKRFRFLHDQFAVKCVDKKQQTIFRDYFTDITTKERIRAPPVDVPEKFSLSILAIDSTSRNQFYRHMPETLRFMQKHEFQILHGYTKTGDNSLLAVAGKIFDTKFHGMKGLVRDDMTLNDSAIFADFWKHANFLTKIVKDHGGATLWNDEIMHTGLGLMNYDKFLGFFKPPADYYFRPYYETLFTNTEIASTCLNGQSVIPRWLRMWESFALKYAYQWNLAFNFITTITHDMANPLELMDEPLLETLKRLEKGGVFENTVLIILGDHGNRMASWKEDNIQKTFTGRIEERMPFMSIYLPHKFRDAHPEEYQNLIENKNRLVSNFDLHETFRDLLHFHNQPHNPVGISLFRKIPKHRTCEDARIPEHLCMCMHQEHLDLNARDKAIISLNTLIDRLLSATDDSISNREDNPGIKLVILCPRIRLLVARELCAENYKLHVENGHEIPIYVD